MVDPWGPHKVEMAGSAPASGAVLKPLGFSVCTSRNIETYFIPKRFTNGPRLSEGHPTRLYRHGVHSLAKLLFPLSIPVIDRGSDFSRGETAEREVVRGACLRGHVVAAGESPLLA